MTLDKILGREFLNRIQKVLTIKEKIVNWITLKNSVHQKIPLRERSSKLQRKDISNPYIWQRGHIPTLKKFNSKKKLIEKWARNLNGYSQEDI